MKTVFSAATCLISALTLLALWHMFFIMEIPYHSIGDASGESWYQHSYWGLLLAALSNIVTSALVISSGAYAFIKGRRLAMGLERAISRMLALSIACALYGLYVLGSFIFVSCAC